MKVQFVCQEQRWDLVADVHCDPPRCDPPRCGGSGVISIEPTRWEEGRVEAQCPVCQLTTYSDVSEFTVVDHELPLAVGVLALQQNFVLVVPRKNDPTAFGLPGGKVDPSDGDLAPPTFGDTLRRAAVRELREETGITLDPSQLEFFYQGVCPGGADGVAYWMVTLKVRGELNLNPVPQSGEGAAQWGSWSMLLNGPFGGYSHRIRRALLGDMFDRRMLKHFKREPFVPLCGDKLCTYTTDVQNDVDCPTCDSLLNLAAEHEYMSAQVYDSLGVSNEFREP
jgi:8-oxo-dGTP pyrophosphatase MutT (NUDIX family)